MADEKAPPSGGVELTVTFFYYRNLAEAMRFYERVLGLALAIDQGWSKIYCIGGGAHLGLVDESKGSNRAAVEKPVQLCIRVPDVDAWHGHAASCGVAALSEVRSNAQLGIRAFTFEDPEGYQIEVQTATREGA